MLLLKTEEDVAFPLMTYISAYWNEGKHMQ